MLYDAGCSLCRFLRDWLARQRQLVPLEFVPAGSEEAHRRFPGLDHRGTLEETCPSSATPGRSTGAPPPGW
ncbi:hypothetical protein GCM10009535_38710 [Streptomyces thermocarboxydovorans]|uniref:DUF393 domain-containing protein n=1 Tax=Streptomyces thermocarboxydovorans TaxID=59298 RepID=A0ABP3SVA1_9ACTN